MNIFLFSHVFIWTFICLDVQGNAATEMIASIDWASHVFSTTQLYEHHLEFVKGYLYIVVDMLLFICRAAFVSPLCIYPCVLFDIDVRSGSASAILLHHVFNWFTAVLLATAIQDPQPCTVQHLLYTLILLSIIPFQADWFDLSAVLPLYTFNVFWCIPKVYVTQRMFNLWNLFWLTHAILFLPLSGGAPLSSWLTVSWRLIQPCLCKFKALLYSWVQQHVALLHPSLDRFSGHSFSNG